MATNLAQILARLANERAAPLPEPAAPAPLGPLSTDTSLAFAALNPEPVPPAFVQPAPVDMNFVSQFAGPAPTAPVIEQPGMLERIAAVLSGIAAGPGYGLALREQREAPLRRFERQQEQFQDRRARAVELAESRSEREADRANRMLENQYEREFRGWLQKQGLRSEEAQLRARQAFELEREARRLRYEEAKEQQREQRRREEVAAGIAARLSVGPGAAPPAIAKEIGEYLANLRPGLSPAAAKWQNAQARRAEILASRTGGGGGGGGRRASNAAVEAFQKFQTARQALIDAIRRGDGASAQAHRENMNRLYKSLARFPADIRLATTDPAWPWAELINAPAQVAAPAPQQPQAAAKTITRAEMQALGVTEAQARAEGFTVVP